MRRQPLSATRAQRSRTRRGAPSICRPRRQAADEATGLGAPRRARQSEIAAGRRQSRATSLIRDGDEPTRMSIVQAADDWRIRTHGDRERRQRQPFPAQARQRVREQRPGACIQIRLLGDARCGRSSRTDVGGPFGSGSDLDRRRSCRQTPPRSSASHIVLAVVREPSEHVAVHGAGRWRCTGRHRGPPPVTTAVSMAVIAPTRRRSPGAARARRPRR